MKQIKKGDSKAIKLSDEFNCALIRYENGHFIYQAEEVIRILTKSIKESIENSILDFDSTLFTIDEAAEMYAIDDFFYNYEGQLGEGMPKFIHNSEEEVFK